MVPAMFAVLALAGPPDSDRLLARQLHTEAMDALDAGDLDTAAARWRMAEQLSDEWKYSWHLANALLRADAPIEAWEALGRAIDAAPTGNAAALTRELGALERVLLQQHARIELDVFPQTATVLLNDRLWPPPRRAWVRPGTGRLELSLDGYEPVVIDWTWTGGRVLQKSVHLAAVPRRIAPTSPEPSIITRAPRELEAPETTAVEAVTEPSAVSRGKWIAAGATAVFLTVGAVAMARAQSLIDDTRALPTESRAEYGFGYERNAERYEVQRVLGITMLVLGGAAAATATTLFVLDHRETTLTVTPLPNGAALLLRGQL